MADPEEWHTCMAGRRTLVAEEDAEVVGFAELEGDGHLDMLYLRKDAVPLPLPGLALEREFG